MPSKAYEEALKKSREVTTRFLKAREDYRAKRIGDAEFLAIRAEYQASEREFDLAFAAESEGK